MDTLEKVMEAFLGMRLLQAAQVCVAFGWLSALLLDCFLMRWAAFVWVLLLGIGFVAYDCFFGIVELNIFFCK